MTPATFTVSFTVDGPAFERGDADAIADVRISLRQVAHMVSERGCIDGPVVDLNGEKIGRFGLIDAD
jgi:hypothetical protein